jgi:scyllo-inositol 2-dehydrogenase (NADP+)
MIRIALVGLGKMGLSHQAIINSHPDAKLVSVCDSAGYFLDLINKYTGVKCYSDLEKMLNIEKLDAIFIATPSRTHGAMVRMALEKNLHVFCEKPFCLDLTLGRELVSMAEARRLVNQVGYHNRFIASFVETKRLIEAGILGDIHNVKIESYGPVVLKAKSATWRAKKSEGGGCLYDYASHGIDLLNYLIGRPDYVGGTALNKIFSSDVEDEVHSTLFYTNGLTAQLAANWSDESFRKMSNKVSIWGRNGKIVVDRQELQVFLRTKPLGDGKLNAGWNVLYTTELTEDVWYYLRGEEYSAQVDHFIESIKTDRFVTRSSFRSAFDADTISSMMLEDAMRDSAQPIHAKPTVTSSGGGWRGSVRDFYATFRQSSG